MNSDERRQAIELEIRNSVAVRLAVLGFKPCTRRGPEALRRAR